MSQIDVEKSRARIEAFSRKHRIALMTMLFTDIEGSTRLKQVLGDREAIELIQRHHGLIRELIGRFEEAEEIGTAGDSFFIVFAKPSDAAHFSLLMQTSMRRLRVETGHPVLDRIGIHVGEVFVQERAGVARDLFGIQIDTASRIMSLGNADQILLSRFAFDSARQILRGAQMPEIGDLTWLNHGYYEMKGVEEPIEVCEVGESGLAALSPPADSEKAHRFRKADEEPVLGWRPAQGQLVPDRRWVLERCLGQGGFGEVWLAQHEELRETCVFKFCFKADRVRSLKREVTLFRILREHVGTHRNIIAIHDVFFDEPPFYIMMDYVDGPTFDIWAAERAAGDDTFLDIRLEVIAQIADGLQAAHDAGVIHRDVKPSNVLVAEDKGGACAKLTDFGIGQVVSPEALASGGKLGFTQTLLASTTASGTQIYIAPEIQAGQPATTRSDIYSLGVVLWQTLAGDFTKPLTSDWDESVADPLLRDDIRQCVAGDPQKRFASAAQLAARLRALPERRVADQEEKSRLAALERRAYRRGAMRAGIVALAIVVVIAGFALWALRNEKRANAARADADELNTYLLSDVREQLEEVGRLDLLEAAAQRAQAYLTRLGPPADVLQHTQRLLLAHNLGRLRQSQGRLGQARDILQEADVASRSSRYQQSAFKTARARILNALCDLRARTGENAEGQQAGRDSLGILSSLGGVDLAALRTDTLVNLCDLQKLAHEYDAAEASITQALQLIEPLTKPTEGARTARRLHLRALLRAGDLASARGNAAAAQAAFENRLKTAQNYSEVDPPTSLWKVEIALSHDRLAQYWLDQTQLEKAASSADGAVALWNDLLVHDPDNLEWLRSQATARTKRGQIFLADQDFASASEIFTIVIALNDKLVHTAPDNLNWRAGLATSHSLLGDALGSLGDTAAALREARIALGIRRELHKDKSGQMDDTNTRNLALSLTKTAGLLMQNGDYPEAEKLAEEAHAIAREVAERPNPLPDHRALLASAIETHGETLIGQERQPKGLKYYQEAKSLRIALVHDFPDDVGFRRRLADCHESIAELEKDRRETQNARTELNSAIMLRRRLSEQLPGSQTDHDALARSEAARQALDKVDK